MMGRSTPPSPTPPTQPERTPRRPRTPTPPPRTPENRIVVGGHGLRKTPSRIKGASTPAVPHSRRRQVPACRTPLKAAGSSKAVDRVGRSATRTTEYDVFSAPPVQEPPPVPVPSDPFVPSTVIPEQNGHHDPVARRMNDLERDNAEKARRIEGLETGNAENRLRIVNLETRVAEYAARDRAREESQAELERQVAVLMTNWEGIDVAGRGQPLSAGAEVKIRSGETEVTRDGTDALVNAREQCRIALHLQEARGFVRLQEVLGREEL